MGANELHEHAPEGKRYVDDQPVSVAAEIKDDPVVAHEIHTWSATIRFFDTVATR
jgi:hypothetical protein